MTTRQLKERVTYQWKGYGNYKVTIEYRGKLYTCYSNNSLAIDRITSGEDVTSSQEAMYDYTYKGALQSLYEECKRANNLL